MTDSALFSTFVHGVNLPWFDGQYGHDIGPEPQNPDYGVWYNGPKITAYFQDIKNIGFQVIRFWLMERAEGWTVDEDGIITGLNEIFLRNLDDVLQRAKHEDLKLYLCLTAGWNEVRYPSPIKDLRQQESYLENAVRPIARRYKDNETIFAFDVINEIESELEESAGQHKVTIEQAKTFIRKNVETIKNEDPNRLVSSGSGWHGWMPVQYGHYSGLGLDFYDIHVYRNDGYLPPVSELNSDRPVFVGEFGQGTEAEDDSLQQAAVANFIKNAMALGYAGCFAWAYGPQEKYHYLVRTDGSHRPVVHDIHRIITG